MVDDIITRDRGIEAEAQSRYIERIQRGSEWQAFADWCRKENKKACFGSTLKEYVKRMEVKA